VTARPNDGTTFPLLGFDDLLAMPDPTWLIDSLVPGSGLSVLYGAPAAGKSFIALDWALCVATGLPWHGHEVEQRWVVYVAAEGRGGLKARAKAWWESRGRPDMSQVRWLPEAINLTDTEQIERARKTLASLPERPGLLVVDTVARTMVGGDENSARDLGLFINAVDGLRGADAALAVHHTGKDGKEERGSSALRAAADLMAKVVREGKSPRLDLSCDKMKDAEGWPDLPLRLEQLHGSCIVSLVAGSEEKRDDLHDRVLAFITEQGPASKRAVRGGVEGSNQRIDQALSALESGGLIHRIGDGWRACLSAPGTPRHGGHAGHGEEPCPQGGDVPKAPPAEARPQPPASVPVPRGTRQPGHGHPQEPGSPPAGQSPYSPSANGKPPAADHPTPTGDA
jgi:hypothetical protein